MSRFENGEEVVWIKADTDGPQIEMPVGTRGTIDDEGAYDDDTVLYVLTERGDRVLTYADHLERASKFKSRDVDVKAQAVEARNPIREATVALLRELGESPAHVVDDGSGFLEVEVTTFGTIQGKGGRAEYGLIVTRLADEHGITAEDMKVPLDGKQARAYLEATGRLPRTFADVA